MLDQDKLSHLHNLEIESNPAFCVWEGSIVRTKMLSLVHALSRDREVRVLDLGCGRAKMWQPLLQACPNVELFGIDPSPAGVAAAQQHLKGLAAHIAKGDVRNFAAIFPDVPKFDFIVSHSVLEHVVPRHLFFPGIKSRLATEGAALISWGSDHFVQSTVTDIRNKISEWLAVAGVERYYAKKVDEAWALAAITDAKLKLEGRYFHSHVPIKKMYAKSQGPERHVVFQHWIKTEESLNRSTDAEAAVAPFMDETFVVLTHA